MRSAVGTMLRAVADRHPEIDVYVFGSTVYGTHLPVDLDLLAVYLSSEQLDAFREDLEKALPAMPIDLTAMTPDELRGSGFLARSRAARLLELDQSLRLSDRVLPDRSKRALTAQ